jgi:hypothetical protein
VRIRTRLAAILAGLVLASGGIALVPAGPAGAVQQEICGYTNTAPPNPQFPCLNAWNGGPYVKAEGPGTTNENFTEQQVFGRCQSGSALTTSGCPIAGIPAGYLIVQLRHGTTCVADLNGASGDAHAASNGTCNNTSTGTGGSFGTIFVARATSCPQTGGYWNAHWSSSWNGGLAGLAETGGTNGSQFWLNVSNAADCLKPF